MKKRRIKTIAEIAYERMLADRYKKALQKIFFGKVK